jgi:hypothetical protein
MTANTATATDQMNALIGSIMASQHPGVEIQWQGVSDDSPPDPQVSWVRVYIRHANGGQASLASNIGKRKWNRQGVLMVQCFVPLNKGGLDAARDIATALQNGIQGAATDGDVWFRNATVNEVGRSDGWYQVNFSALFTYDDVQ